MIEFLSKTTAEILHVMFTFSKGSRSDAQVDYQAAGWAFAICTANLQIASECRAKSSEALATSDFTSLPMSTAFEQKITEDLAEP